jgi:hypothetical protein
MLALPPNSSLAQTQKGPAIPVLSAKDTLDKTNLPADAIEQILQQVEVTSFDFPDSWEEELRARSLPLGDSEGLVVQGSRLLCGGTGNCQTWLFLKADREWRTLFEEQAPIGSGFTFSPNIHHALHDFVVDSNTSAAASRRTVFVFDGAYYRATTCFDVNSATGSEVVKPIACE